MKILPTCSQSPIPRLSELHLLVSDAFIRFAIPFDDFVRATVFRERHRCLGQKWNTTFFSNRGHGHKTETCNHSIWQSQKRWTTFLTRLWECTQCETTMRIRRKDNSCNQVDMSIHDFMKTMSRSDFRNNEQQLCRIRRYCHRLYLAPIFANVMRITKYDWNTFAKEVSIVLISWLDY